MRQALRIGVMAAAAATGILSVPGSSASAATGDQEPPGGSAGVLSGNSVSVPLSAPVNLCGDTFDASAVADPASGNRCGNESDTAATTSRTSGATHSGGFLSGNSVQAPVDVGLNLCGDTVGAVAAADPALGNSCASAGSATAVVPLPRPWCRRWKRTPRRLRRAGALRGRVMPTWSRRSRTRTHCPNAQRLRAPGRPWHVHDSPTRAPTRIFWRLRLPAPGCSSVAESCTEGRVPRGAERQVGKNHAKALPDLLRMPLKGLPPQRRGADGWEEGSAAILMTRSSGPPAGRPRGTGSPVRPRCHPNGARNVWVLGRRHHVVAPA
ncbi:chaplin [Streptomyces sp. SID14478]|nr:chaplin [Streptomyces sp. SID14478]